MIIEDLREIAVSLDLDLFVLFGSQVKNSAKDNSDYDLAFFKKNCSVEDEIKIIDVLEDFFKDKKFDLINLEKDVSPVLKKDIFYEGVCVFEKNKGFFQKEKERAYFDYVDYFTLLKPTIDKYLTNG